MKTKPIDIQRIRNITTGILHTEMTHIYQDIEYFVGEPGVMTHMLPNAVRALLPYLKQYVLDPLFWNGEYDKNHLGTISIPQMNTNDVKFFWKQYKELPHPFTKIGSKSQ